MCDSGDGSRAERQDVPWSVHGEAWTSGELALACTGETDASTLCIAVALRTREGWELQFSMEFEALVGPAAGHAGNAGTGAGSDSNFSTPANSTLQGSRPHPDLPNQECTEAPCSTIFADRKPRDRHEDTRRLAPLRVAQHRDHHAFVHEVNEAGAYSSLGTPVTDDLSPLGVLVDEPSYSVPGLGTE